MKILLLKVSILIGLGLALLGGFLYVSSTTIKNKAPLPKKNQSQVSYKDGEVSFASNHTQEELSLMVDMIRKGKITSQQIDENTYWELDSFIQDGLTIDSQNINDLRLLHEMAVLYRSTPMGIQGLSEDMHMYGNKKAPDTITSFIHTTLKEKNCIIWDVPVYQLTDDSGAAGNCTAHGIWIRDISSLDKHNCSHETGHWFYQHPLRSISLIDQEYEADNFAYDCLSYNERIDLVNSVASGQMSRGEPYDSNWLRIAKEHGELVTKKA